MSQQALDRAALIVEFATLYEISSLSNYESLEQLAVDALEKALRLFDVRRFGLWSGPPAARHILAMSGLRDEKGALRLASEHSDCVFAEALGMGGELGFLFMEERSAITHARSRIYHIFARRIEESLLRAHSQEERQRVLEALALSEVGYRAMFENTGTAIIILEEDRTICLVNKKCEELLGYSRDEVVGKKKWAEFMDDPVELEQVMTLSRERRKTVRHTGSYELRLRRGDGTVRTVWVTASPIPGSSQTIASLIDITDLREAQQAMRESEEKFRSLFEQSMDALYIHGPDGQNLIANQTWIDLFGYSQDEMGRLRATDLYADPADRDDFLCRIAKTGFVEDEVRLKKKNGSVMDCVRTVVSRKDDRGEVVAYQGVIRDITERKRMEADLRASSEQMSRLAQRVEEVREEERTSLARELHDTAGQAITALKLDVGRMKKRLEEGQMPSPEDLGALNKLLDQAADEVRRVSSELRPGVLDDIGLSGAIEWQIDEIRKRTDLDFAMNLPSVESLLDYARRTALFRVFQELLTNVVRHADAGSVRVTLECADNVVTLTVADDGCGAGMETLEDSRAIGIIGMRERLRPFGGELHYDSTPGKGTTARVVMPTE